MLGGAWHDVRVTAPLTPPHQPSPHDPWQTPSAHGGGDGARAEPAGPVGPAGRRVRPLDPELRTDIRRAVVVLVVTTVAGLLLGLLWAWLAPKVPLISTDKAVFLRDTEGEEAAAADGTFVLLSVGFGLASAALGFLFHRRRGGIPLVVALLLGSLLGAVAGWLTGRWFGPMTDVVAHAKAVGVGVVFDAPLELEARSGLLVWPFVAVLVQLGLMAVWGEREPEREFEWGAYYGEPGAGAGADKG